MGQGASSVAELAAAKGWPAFMTQRDMEAQLRAFQIGWSGRPYAPGSRVRLQHPSGACLEYQYIRPAAREVYYQRVDGKCGTKAALPTFPSALAERETRAAHMPYRVRLTADLNRILLLRDDKCAAYVYTRNGVWRKAGTCTTPSQTVRAAARSAVKRARWARQSLTSRGAALVPPRPVKLAIKAKSEASLMQDPGFRATFDAFLGKCVRAGVTLMRTPPERFKAQARALGFPAESNRLAEMEIYVRTTTKNLEEAVVVSVNPRETLIRIGEAERMVSMSFTLTRPPAADDYGPRVPARVLRVATDAWRAALSR